MRSKKKNKGRGSASARDTFAQRKNKIKDFEKYIWLNSEASSHI